VKNKQNKNKYSFLGITPEKAIMVWNNYFKQGELYVRKKRGKD
jgi:hypothetical protein